MDNISKNNRNDKEETLEIEPIENSSQEELSYELKIPLERVAVLIGKDGETKKQIEDATKSKLQISPEGDVLMTGTDGLTLFITKEVVLAVGRGFNPKKALLLLKTDYVLEIINMTDIAGKNKNMLERLKGRVIGTGGKAREEVERLTDTHVSVYGKTIAIIGEVNQVHLARQAMAMLLEGAMHKTVYQFLEKKKKEIIFG
ncbi:RNA-processing protein [Candidatus Woesearchaeota archaeon]|nr:RNA-processing protein [Candidatus Woesearchaeota archaeon]